MFSQSTLQLKLKRTADSTEIWKFVDHLRDTHHKVGTTMSMDVITINIFPYPRENIMEKVKELCAKYRI